jgi:foldase protein PrsA
MGKRITIIALSLALLLAGCASGNDSQAPGSATEATEATEATTAAESTEAATQPEAAPAAHRTAPTDETVISMGEYASNMVVYTYYYSNIRDNLMMQASQMGYTDETMSELWTLDQGGQTIKQLLDESALQMSKEHAILYDMAEKAGTAPNAEANTADDELVAEFLSEVDGDEQAFIDMFFITPAQMKEISYRINLVGAYQTNVVDAIEVTDEEIQAEYDANKANYEQVTVRHVLIGESADMTDDEKAAAKQKADDILARIQAGEDIGALAAEFSEDPGSKDTNGEYTFPRGQMVAEFEDWAFAAKVGDQGIVKSTHGYHVMQLMADASFESVKPLVEEAVKMQKAQATFAELPELVASPDWVIETDKLDVLVP